MVALPSVPVGGLLGPQGREHPLLGFPVVLRLVLGGVVVWLFGRHDHQKQGPDDVGLVDDHVQQPVVVEVVVTASVGVVRPGPSVRHREPRQVAVLVDLRLVAIGVVPPYHLHGVVG